MSMQLLAVIELFPTRTLGAFCVALGVACVAVAVGCILSEQLQRWASGLMAKFLALSPLNKAVLVIALAVSTVCAQKGTNRPPAMVARPVPQNEVAQVWQPVGGSVVRAEVLYRCGATEDALRLTFGGGFVFPDGTNHLDRVAILSSGEVRRTLQDRDSLVSFGERLWSRPYDSKLTAEHTPSNSYRLVWRNFYANGDTNLPRTASAELFRNGNLAVTENGVTTITPYEIPFPHDGFGQDDEWVRANFTNAAEVLSVGYADWVDDQVGVDLENGLYKFTATFPVDPPEATRLFVGDRSVCVTNAGEYVFLLEKGVEYEFGLEPFVEGVEFEAVDDIPAAEELRMPLMAQAGHWEGRWTKDDGDLYLTSPQLGETGCIIWTPKLRVSPEEWNPSAGDPAETFTAMLFDRTDWITEPTYAWTSVGDLVSFGSPLSATTRATCRTVMAEGVAAYLNVSFGEWQLQSSLMFRRQNEDVNPTDYATCWMEDLPDTLFVNNDNDLGGASRDCDGPDVSDDDIPCACIRLSSSVPTNGTIRIDNMEGFVGYPLTYADDSSLYTRAAFSGSTWNVQDATSKSIPLFFNAVGKSDGFETSQIKIRWTPEVGQEQTYIRRFTVVEPVAEPVCTETKPVSVNGETVNLVYNPCGVAVGRDAYFKIEVKPTAYPDSMIEWETSGEGSVQFVGGNHGREVHVRGVSPGDVTLSAKLGNCVSPPPSFTFRVVTNRIIRLSAWIVSDENNVPARSFGDVRDMVKTVNDIYSQVGVTFDLGDRITVTNIPAAYDINWEGNAAGRWSFQQLTDMNSTSDSVECYFVNGIFKVRANKSVMTIGGHNESGIVVSANGTAVTLAHELGHRLGMSDIYWQTEDNVVLSGFACWSRCMDDWNGGCNGSGSAGARYYPSGMLQRNIVRSMLMDGMKDNTSYGVDITYGDVFGLDGQGQERDCATGYFNR